MYRVRSTLPEMISTSALTWALGKGLKPIILRAVFANVRRNSSPLDIPEVNNQAKRRGHDGAMQPDQFRDTVLIVSACEIYVSYGLN